MVSSVEEASPPSDFCEMSLSLAGCVTPFAALVPAFSLGAGTDEITRLSGAKDTLQAGAIVPPVQGASPSPSGLGPLPREAPFIAGVITGGAILDGAITGVDV